ncbi:MAG: T9SS type A sorting domain-containing protein, partial [Bacteroidales bacterium]|nr:T9SS type A sorting domain-containing protein [Bacteroidales bacterium]
ALAEAGKTTIYAYPNPVQNYLRIEGATADATCTVYDLQGRALLHSAAQHIDVTTLQQGSYFIKINNQIIKFIKK